MFTTLKAKIKRRCSHYAVRLSRFVVFSNTLRMFVYRHLAGIEVGRYSMIWAGNRINDPTNLTIGDNCIIGPENVFLTRGGVAIGNNVNLSGYGFFISQQHAISGNDFTRTICGRIALHDRVWVATNCTIMPGVTIHEGGVVAAGSVVTKDVDAWTVVAGNPARKIADRELQLNYDLVDMKGSKWL